MHNEILSSIIEDAFADKEHKLIGNQDFTDDDYSAMVNEVGNLYQNNYFQTSDCKLIFLTLVEIAKRWRDSDTFEDNEENSGFWCFVFKTLTGIDEHNQTLYGQFTSLISEMGRQNKIPTVKTGKKYYATLMMHAFAPKKSIHSFFDLCYNVFKKDLEFGFTSEDEWLCEIVANQIASVLGSGYREDKKVSIGSSAYSIKIGLRSFALNEDLKPNFIKFITDTFYQINQLFNREKIEEDTRLKRYIVEWWKNKIALEKLPDEIVRKKRVPTVSKQNIVVKYIRDDNDVFICIPSIRLDDNKNTMFLTIYVNGEQVHSEEMRTKRGELVVATKEKEFRLNDLLKYYESINIQVKITENEIILYDSKETLNREFILFEDSKEVFSQINKPSNYFVYSKNIDALKNIPDDLTTYSKNLYNIYPKAGESLTGKTRHIFFVNKEKAARLGNTVCLIGNLTDVEWLLDEYTCVVYGNSVKLMIPETLNLKALELRIDGAIYKLENLKYEQIENNCYQFGLKTLGLISENYPTAISVFSYEKESTLLLETIISLPNLNVEFSHTAYYGDIERKLNIINGTDTFETTWSNQENEVKVPLKDGNLLVKVPYIRWRISDKEWYNEPINRKLWYENILQNGDLLEIDNPKEGEEIKVFCRIGGQKIEIPKNQSGKFEIGRAIYTNENQTDIKVYFQSETNKYDIFILATKEHFVENPISYVNGKVYWNVEDTFVGDKNNEFFLAIKSDKNNFRNKIASSDCEINNIWEYDICKIQVKIKDKNIFSKHESYTTIFEDKLIIGKREQFRFKNKCLKIESVSSSFSNEGNWITPCRKYVIYDLKFIEEINEDKTYEYYEGILGIINDNLIKKIEFMKNEDNYEERINPVHIELRNNNTFWLKAGYDNRSDFYNENLMLNIHRELCFININENKVINLYRFKEEEYV